MILKFIFYYFIFYYFAVDKEKEKQKLQSLMAFGKIIPLTPVHKKRSSPKAYPKTPAQADRFTECKYVTTENIVMHVCFCLRI
jgi:hypothetical protein